MRFGWSPKEASARIRMMAKIAAVVFLAIYAAVYIWEPFSDLWNNILSNLLLVIAAGSTALVAIMLWTLYDETDTPRRVWFSFAIGLWVWTFAELTWGYLNVTQGEVQEGIADAFWTVGYVFFGFALFNQYCLLARPSKQELLKRISVVALILLALYFLIYRVLASWADAEDQFGVAINSFYPVGDLFLGVVAIWMIRNFQGGAFARPWLGLLAFSFTDFFYAWMEASGLYTWTVNNANWATTLFDIAYVAAYLVLALGILSQWAFLKYGLLSSPSKK